ncbi:ABC transporter, putative [Ixodes scapularis]|uniref:ABC transporter, putative n=1 Tax=Ixodes scapularis TaxID=6945 RepID=B7PN55_IXOSC|nr:ABC transporter, putative [Ixodes scapularis]|eukprot:XP_002435203.1 ABC transporter, putative [Ixodes scapularis]
MPLLMVASLMSIRSGLKPSSKPAHRGPLGHVLLVTPSHLSQITTELMAAPATAQVGAFMRQVVEFLNSNTYSSGFNFSLYNNSSDMEQAYRFNVTHSAVGIVFSDDLEKSGSYQIRFPLRHVPSPDVKRVGIEMCRVKHFIFSSDSVMCPAASYYSSGFSALQAAIDFCFIKVCAAPHERTTAWFLVEAVVVVNVCLIMTGMVYVLHILPNTDIVLVFVISLLYGFTVVMFSFMATPFFSKSKVAGSVVGLMMLLFSFFYMLSVFLRGRVSTWVFYVIALLSPAAFTLGIERISQMDVIGSMRFRNVFEDGFSVGSSMLMLLFDIFLYGFLAYYFDAIIPGEFGQSRSPWFIFRCFAPWKAKEVHDKSAKSEIAPNADVEDRPAELLGREAIRIQDLRKVFHSWRQEPVVAVDGISLCMHEGQIAALLGHNGAGKSTLLNMLVGTLSPSQGTARIYGLSTEDAEDVAQIRSMLGVCLQEDILFDALTARQHLTFFARMKGIPKSCIDEEVENILRELDLTDKADVPAVKLSGGQKRKLSVGIALIGDPKQKQALRKGE